MNKLKRWISSVFKAVLIHIPTIFPNRNTVLILRTDNIGDYILFRHFLQILRGAEAYKSKKIVLVGNDHWRDLAECFDGEHIDSFIWVNKKKFYASKLYKLQTLFKLRQLNAFEIINTVHSISYFEEKLVLFSGAINRITCQTDDINISFNQQNHALFNTIIPSLPPSSFEFFRNKTFMENLLQLDSKVVKTSFDIKKVVKKNQIAIFPSAAEKQRRWSPLNFSQVIHLIHDFDEAFEFIILGSHFDIEIGNIISENCTQNTTIHNLCGKTSLIDLVDILNESRLLISNETSAVHIAAAIDLPTVCVSNGERFARFSPYPLTLSDKITTIYPDDSFYNAHMYNFLVETYQYKSEIDINIILPESVFGVVKTTLEINCL
jgi:ADP-heptose:LPS heptosyltransferase